MTLCCPAELSTERKYILKNIELCIDAEGRRHLADDDSDNFASWFVKPVVL